MDNLDNIETPADDEALNRFVSEQEPSLLGLVAAARLLASGPGPITDKAEGMVTIAERLSQLITPYTPCRKGCNHCCYMATAVSKFEADMIGRYLGRDPADAGQPGEDYEKDVGTMRDKWTGQRCTLLGEDGKCTVYPVRPIACRVHHNFAKDEENCRMVGVGARRMSTPAINLDGFQLTAAYVLGIQGGYAYADIRDWFPAKLQSIANET